MTIILENLKQKRYLIQTKVFFSFLIAIYFILDYLNLGYKEMIQTYGLYLVIINIVLNLIMASLSAVLMSASEMLVKSKARTLGFIAIIFGMFTYGCTTCLIALLANLGIIFSVMILPLAGLPYKIISLILILIGFLITINQIKKGCKVKES